MKIATLYSIEIAIHANATIKFHAKTHKKPNLAKQCELDGSKKRANGSHKRTDL